MAYVKKTWVKGDEIVASALNNIEDGISTLDTEKVARALKTGSDSVYKVLSDNNLTDTIVSHITGIEENAQVNVIESIEVDGVALTPDGNKVVNIDLSGFQKVGTDLEIEAGNTVTVTLEEGKTYEFYVSNAFDSDSEIEDGSSYGIYKVVINSLPEAGTTNTIYSVFVIDAHDQTADYLLYSESEEVYTFSFVSALPKIYKIIQLD